MFNCPADLSAGGALGQGLGASEVLEIAFAGFADFGLRGLRARLPRISANTSEFLATTLASNSKAELVADSISGPVILFLT